MVVSVTDDWLLKPYPEANGSHEWSLGAKSGSRKWDYFLWYFPAVIRHTIDRTDRDTKVNIVFSSIIFSIDTIRCTCYINKVPFIGRCGWGYWICNLHPSLWMTEMKWNKEKQNVHLNPTPGLSHCLTKPALWKFLDPRLHYCLCTYM